MGGRREWSASPGGEVGRGSMRTPRGSGACGELHAAGWAGCVSREPGGWLGGSCRYPDEGGRVFGSREVGRRMDSLSRSAAIWPVGGGAEGQEALMTHGQIQRHAHSQPGKAGVLQETAARAQRCPGVLAERRAPGTGVT